MSRLVPPRVLRMAKLHHDGLSLQAVADRQRPQISRQRVHELLRRYEQEIYPRRDFIHPERLATLLLERRSVRSIAVRLGVTRQAVYDALARFRLPTPTEVVEMLPPAACGVTRAAMLTHLRLLAVKLGHSPTARDMRKGQPRGYTFGAYQARFGSLGAALDAAHLPRRKRGELVTQGDR